MSMKLFFTAASLSLLFAGCLKTRSDVKDVEQRQVLQQQVSTIQKESADAGGRFSEMNEDIRDLRGRVEVVEHKMSGGDQDKVRNELLSQNQEITRRLGLLQEGMTRQDAQIQALNAEIFSLKGELAARGAQATAANMKKDPFEQGTEFFDQKDWKKAILNYEKYRSENPKGKKVPEATYRIAVSFQELGFKDEARTFYDEVISKYPNSNEAKKAKQRLKSLKK